MQGWLSADELLRFARHRFKQVDRRKERQCVTFVLGRETQILAQGVVNKIFGFARLGDNCFEF